MIRGRQWRVLDGGALSEAMAQAGLPTRMELYARAVPPYERRMGRGTAETLRNKVLEMSGAAFLVEGLPVLASQRALVQALGEVLGVEPEGLLGAPPTSSFVQEADTRFYAGLEPAAREELDGFDELVYEVISLGGDHATVSAADSGWTGLRLAVVAAATLGRSVPVPEPGDLLLRLARHPGLPRVAPVVGEWTGLQLRLAEDPPSAAEALAVQAVACVLMSRAWWAEGRSLGWKKRSWKLEVLRPTGPGRIPALAEAVARQLREAWTPPRPRSPG